MKERERESGLYSGEIEYYETRRETPVIEAAAFSRLLLLLSRDILCADWIVSADEASC